MIEVIKQAVFDDQKCDIVKENVERSVVVGLHALDDSPSALYLILSMLQPRPQFRDLIST